MNFKKALSSPSLPESRDLVDDSVRTLLDIADRKPSFAPHALHILGSCALEWFDDGIDELVDKKVFLNNIHEKILASTHLDNDKQLLNSLARKIKRELLGLALSTH